jgi:hypothetical protein
MALSVIGAGFGRTGTNSMKLALEHLGLGTCHHMFEVMASEDQKRIWREIVIDGVTPDWDATFDGFGCSVDWPSAFYWRELSEHYPDAKILLTVRSPESWYRSFSSTILKVLQSDEGRGTMGYALVYGKVFGGRPDDADHAMAVYEKNIADVQAAIPQERLLTYHVGDGWEPLCQFLGKPVPDIAFPSSNSTAEFHERVEARAAP